MTELDEKGLAAATGAYNRGESLPATIRAYLSAANLENDTHHIAQLVRDLVEAKAGAKLQHTYVVSLEAQLTEARTQIAAKDEKIKTIQRQGKLYISGLRAQIAKLEQHVEELRDKNSDQDCACSFDEPGDVCMGHSPLLKAARAQIAELKASLHIATEDKMNFLDQIADKDAALAAAVRAANLALFVIRKQGVMPNSSWQAGFDSDMKIAEAELAAPAQETK